MQINKITKKQSEQALWHWTLYRGGWALGWGTGIGKRGGV
jgi:hypothetical protein